MKKLMLRTLTFLAVLSFLAPGYCKEIQLQNGTTPVPLEEILVYFREKDVKDAMHLLAKDNERNLLGKTKRKPVGSKTPVVGSEGTVYTDWKYDKGLFSVIFHAYAKHWVLVTTPEDWWFTIIRKVALNIDDNSGKKEVRNFFVSHDGKKELIVKLGANVYNSNYSIFFDQMTEKVEENINKPGYVKIMQSDFSTSTLTHKIVANMAIMSSVQEYFDYTGTILCGIPKVEMKGKEEDWARLKDKFVHLNNYLKGIEVEIGLQDWWPKVEIILQKLFDTYQGNPDQDWWSRIISQIGSAGCGTPEVFDGWFVDDFLGAQPEDLPSGLVSVPMKITDGATDEQSAVVAGIPGVTIDENKALNETRIQAVHAWTLMLEEHSVFRNDIAKWENEIK